MIDALALLAITMYYPHGPVTFCGHQVAAITTPYVAMPVPGPWQCGERVGIWYEDGRIEVYTVLDAGPFGDNCVIQPDGQCLPIALDVASPWWDRPGISARAVRVWSVSEVQAELERRAGR